jgi:hypothetical protein
MAHRTALITAGSIGIVVFAAAVAIGANLGILSVADSRPVGKLSASAAVQSAGLQIEGVPAATPQTAATHADVTQKYIIKKAGTVSVTATKAGLRLADVTARRGWKWALTQSADKRLLVTFRSPSHTYKFRALLGRSHTIVARVDEPVTRVVPSGLAGTAVAWSPAPAVAAANPAPAAPTHGDEPEGGRSGEGGADD